jgi:DNA cross-link repair 1C protein
LVVVYYVIFHSCYSRFLYEGPFGTVLYTGDFRIAKGDSRKFQAFMSNPSRPEYGLKTIDHVYLDCTFCTDSAKTFPSRQTSVDITIDLVSSWIAKSPEHKVLFTLAGRGFGAEFLFVEVYRKLKLQVHTSDFKHQIYSNLSDIKNAISRQRTTSIHACETMVSAFSSCPPWISQSFNYFYNRYHQRNSHPVLRIQTRCSQFGCQLSGI